MYDVQAGALPLLLSGQRGWPPDDSLPLRGAEREGADTKGGERQRVVSGGEEGQ